MIFIKTYLDGYLYDLSNYPRDHPAYDPTNKKIPGLFKDETAGEPVKEFIGLRSKMYSFTYSNTENKRPKALQKRP